MQIQILNLVEGAKEATGLTVIIDVFRAFSLDCYLFDNGAEMIIPVGDIEEAYRLKRENPEYVLIGERTEQMPEGFDFGNSPSHVLNHDFTGKTIVHTTSAGTQGMVNAMNADEVISGSFVNAGAIVEYIKHKNPQTVSLVGMGYGAEYPVEPLLAITGHRILITPRNHRRCPGGSRFHFIAFVIHGAKVIEIMQVPDERGS